MSAEPLKIRLRAASGERRCSFCHEDGGVCAACPFCGAVLHGDCWSELRACPSLGCGFEVGLSPVFRLRSGITAPLPEPPVEPPLEPPVEERLKLTATQEAWLARAVKVPSAPAPPRASPRPSRHRAPILAVVAPTLFILACLSGKAPLILAAIGLGALALADALSAVGEER